MTYFVTLWGDLLFPTKRVAGTTWFYWSDTHRFIQWHTVCQPDAWCRIYLLNLCSVSQRLHWIYAHVWKRGGVGVLWIFIFFKSNRVDVTNESLGHNVKRRDIYISHWHLFKQRAIFKFSSQDYRKKLLAIRGWTCTTQNRFLLITRVKTTLAFSRRKVCVCTAARWNRAAVLIPQTVHTVCSIMIWWALSLRFSALLGIILYSVFIWFWRLSFLYSVFYCMV